ncbi:restriction endonuclease subunit S [Stutzerimonas frequens]|nr:restriction endonuclease subunit S [Stutzerimonas frequens]
MNSGCVDTSQLRKISVNTHNEYRRSQVKGGEILITVVGAGIGEAAIIPPECAGFNIARAVAKLPIREISAKYVYLWLSTNLALSWMKGSSREVARPTLNLEQLRALPVPIPACGEQTEIVRRVEQLFAFADQLEARVKAAQIRIDRLTQSILAKAFRGELVPQDPNDEPASVLLERIKAQRAAAPKAKRGRRAATLG